MKFLIQKNLVIGASGAFINGQTIVCGGATEKYLHCNTINGEGNLKCDRNVDCVTSLGGSKWCSGPKIDECYSYDSVFTQVKKTQFTDLCFTIEVLNEIQCSTKVSDQLLHSTYVVTYFQIP